MLYFDRINVSEGIALIKQVHQECHICQYFLNYSCKFQPNICNRCHDLLMISANLNDIAVFNIKGSDYRCIISSISKNETTLMRLIFAITFCEINVCGFCGIFAYPRKFVSAKYLKFFYPQK